MIDCLQFNLVSKHPHFSRAGLLLNIHICILLLSHSTILLNPIKCIHSLAYLLESTHPRNSGSMLEPIPAVICVRGGGNSRQVARPSHESQHCVITNILTGSFLWNKHNLPQWAQNNSCFLHCLCNTNFMSLL